MQKRVLVIGVGYVGHPLACAFAEVGYRVSGYDISSLRIEELRARRKSSQEPEWISCRDALVKELSHASLVVICVPTPWAKTGHPDLGPLSMACAEVVAAASVGQCIVLESTTYPGTTEELLVGPLEARGFTIGKDISVAFSPERIDPGNCDFALKTTPKLLGGHTPNCTALATQWYREIITEMIPVSSPAAAEMAKLYENIYRAVNIALANEIAISCRSLGLDPYEVGRAAATKPFGFERFQEGPGIGGHCIPVDPLYLNWKLHKLKQPSRLIQVADEINSSMPNYVVQRTAELLACTTKNLSGKKVLILGVSYKEGSKDTRESPAVRVIQELHLLGADVFYFDPLVEHLECGFSTLESLGSEPVLANFDISIVISAHDALERLRLGLKGEKVLDTRSAWRSRFERDGSSCPTGLSTL